MAHRHRWLAGAGALLVAAGLALSGCGGASKGTAAGPTGGGAASLPPIAPEQGVAQFRTPAPGSGQGLKLGYIALGESVPFSKLVTDGIRKQAAAAGAQLVVCDSQLDAAKALACARTFRTQGVQGYLNFQVDEKAAASICAAGPQVPVIAIDIHQRPCEKAFMGANNDYAGYLSGRTMGEYFRSHFGCRYDAFVSMEGPESGAVNEARMGGYRKGFTEACGPIHNLRKVAGDRIDPARTAFADVLTSLPGQHKIIVVGINDDAIEGALAAARTAGRVKDLYVSGQGADPSAWCQIKTNPQWIGDTAYFPERYGEIGVPYLIDLIKGKQVPTDLLVPHKIINSANIDSFYHVTGC